MNYQADRYLSAEVLTASPYRLHQLVVDGALRHACQGQAALQTNDADTARAAFSRSREFVAELISGLRADQAPEIVGPLQSLFVFVYRSLTEAEWSGDLAKADAAVRILEAHRETWRELGAALGQSGGQDAARLNRSA